MNKRSVIDIVLWVLLAIGFFGAAKVSYENFTGSPCPHVGIVPICYVVLVAYGLMILAMLLPHAKVKHFLFCPGWGTAFLVALLGTIAEVTSGGGVCPSSGGGSLRGGAASTGSIPLCYISLALTIVILILFLAGPFKRACDVCNANS